MEKIEKYYPVKNEEGKILGARKVRSVTYISNLPGYSVILDCDPDTAIYVKYDFVFLTKEDLKEQNLNILS